MTVWKGGIPAGSCIGMLQAMATMKEAESPTMKVIRQPCKSFRCAGCQCPHVSFMWLDLMKATRVKSDGLVMNVRPRSYEFSIFWFSYGPVPEHRRFHFPPKLDLRQMNPM